MTEEPTAAPLLRVVKGEPTEEELAAVIAVLSAAGAAPASAPPTFSLWARKSRNVRPVMRAGFGAWRASMMPR